jgi:protease PrsW
MGLLVSIALGFSASFFFAYLVYWMDRYEKEPRILLGFAFFWGAVVAAGVAFLINSLLGAGIYVFTGSEMASELTTGTLIAPIVEETLKGLAVLLVFLIFYEEFDSILDGIVYAAITALGFAATENAFYIYHYGYAANGYSGLLALAFIRIILVGWQHPFYTAFLGIGLAVARLNPGLRIKLLALLAGWLAAVLTHSLHNTLAHLLPRGAGWAVGTLVDWSGWLIMLIFILYIIGRERAMVTTYVREEVELGIITPLQYRTACSAWSQSAARTGSFFRGNYAATRRFYQVCGEISHKKHQLANLGDERGNTRTIETLREELRSLSAQAAA